MDKRDQHFYRSSRLNGWFAVSSLLLLATVVWMVWDDYDRPWKTLQREFFRPDAARTAEMIEAEKERLAQEGVLGELEAELGQAEEELSARAAELNEARAGGKDLEARRYRAEQDYGFAKATLGTRRYEFERTRSVRGQAHAETARAREAYDRALDEAEQHRRAYEKLEAEYRLAGESIDRIIGHHTELAKQHTRLLADLEVHNRRLEALRPGLAATVRDLPIMDFANPAVKVRQIVLRHFERDYHFADVFRADRCVTCHMGIARAGFEDAPQPFTTHPRLDLFLGSTSPHQIDDYGCTVCHGGKGRATDFVDAAHTPDDEQQRARWEAQHGWEKLEHWEHPMLPMGLVEASCRKCHDQEDTIPDAEVYNQGKLLYERLGCFNCHVTESFTETFRKVGPSLLHVCDKVTPEWAFSWITDPTVHRPTTRMPRFFGLANNSDPRSLARADVEVRALVAYLFERSTPQGMVEIPAPGHADAGERLFWTRGCIACHIVKDPNDPGAAGRDFGPNLAAIGSKTTAQWLYNWLRNPQQHFPGARMPSLRLTEQDAADLAAFLARHRAAEPAAGRTFPPLDEALLDSMVTEKLMQRATESEAQRQAGAMNVREQLVYLGERMLFHYGCFGCHEVAGQEKGVRIGRDFTGQDAIGDKSLEQVVFGFVELDHTWQDWLDKKLESPRVFDQGYERRPADKLRMPRFKLTGHQRDALVCFLLSLTNEKIPPDYRRRFDSAELALQRGEALVREYNCRVCHSFTSDRLVFANPLRGRGEPDEIAVRGVVTAQFDEILFFRALEDREVGDLQFAAGEAIEVEAGSLLRWEQPVGGYSQNEILWYYADQEGFDYERTEVEEGDEDARAEWSAFRDAHLHMLPPSLEGEGARAQPEWLFRFLKEPYEMRLQLDLRMPDFSLSDAQAHDLVEYFAAQDGVDFPFLALPERSEEYRQAHGREIVRARQMFDSQEVQCITCHIRGGILPEGDQANWGPDLARAPQRLRPEWIIRWLEDPQLLQPGTKMPTFTSFNDADRTAMKDLLMNFDEFYSTTPE